MDDIFERNLQTKKLIRNILLRSLYSDLESVNDNLSIYVSYQDHYWMMYYENRKQRLLRDISKYTR